MNYFNTDETGDKVYQETQEDLTEKAKKEFMLDKEELATNYN